MSLRALAPNVESLLETYPSVRTVVESAYWRLGALAHRGERTVQVGGVTARFGLSTRAEYLRAKSLGGERPVLEALLGDLEGSETVWDVGACVGTYTCFLAKAVETGRVVGFEPEPTNRARLRANLERNGSRERWAVSGVALWDRDREGTLASEDESGSIEAGDGHHYLSAEGGRRVEARRGASLLAEGFAAPDVLKIDVQGAEGRVLEGMGEILSDVAVIYLEAHPGKCRRYGTTAGEVEAFLREAGYSLTRLGVPAIGRSGVFLRARR